MKAATVNVSVCKVFAEISIHAAREGGDCGAVLIVPPCAAFQSTPPVKAATLARLVRSKRGAISIHAAREGGDV